MRYTKVIPIFLSLVFVFSSCKDERPDGVLSQEQMVALLMDIYVAEGNMTELRLERDSVLKIFKVYEQIIFERHQVDTAQYNNSLTYYYDHPGKLEKIYETILDSLTLRESYIKAKEEAKVDTSKVKKNIKSR